MKGYVCLFALLLACGASALAQTNSEEAAVLKAERSWLQASQSNDVGTLKEIIADDFVGSGPGGNTITKEMITSIPEGAPPFSNTKLSDMSVKVFGSTAVVFGKIASTNPVDPPITRFAMFYQKRSGQWKMIAAQLVPIQKELESSGQ